MVNRSFFWGAVTGIVGVYVFHRFVKAVPGKASS